MRLGQDAEVFLRGTQGFVSVVGMVEGNKENPWQIPGMDPGFTLQQDNVALEFGTPPAASKKEWIEYITRVKLAGLDVLKGLRYSKSSCVLFAPEELQTAEARLFGCDPDFNAWKNGEKNPKPKPSNDRLRSAGGHVHIETSIADKMLVVRVCDLFLGLWSLVEDVHGNMRRSEMGYGKAGAYRPKSYGAEYRSLSNFWLFKTKYLEQVWDKTEASLEFATKHPDFFDLRVKEAIDNNNVALARQLQKEYGVC